MRGLANAGGFSLLGMLICMVPMIAGAWYALRPTERLLTLMRPLTIGAVFAALCNFALGIASECFAISRMSALDQVDIRRAAAGFSEGMATVVVCFAALAVAWFLVAMGMRRRV